MGKKSLARYECTAKMQTVGREQGSRSSPLRRRRDGTLYLVNKGDTYHHHGETMPRSNGWVELSQIPWGHGQHFLGYFHASEFDIEGPLEEDAR